MDQQNVILEKTIQQHDDARFVTAGISKLVEE